MTATGDPAAHRPGGFVEFPAEPTPRRKWTRFTLLALAIGLVAAIAKLECVARQVRVETTGDGVSVIEPRGFFSAANVRAFLRVGYSQWIVSAGRNECFSVGDGCTLTGNDPDRDGRVNQVCVMLRDEGLTPHLRGHDRDLGGLRLFFHADPSGGLEIDRESLNELQRVTQALYDSGMTRHAGSFRTQARQ